MCPSFQRGCSDPTDSSARPVWSGCPDGSWHDGRPWQSASDGRRGRIADAVCFAFARTYRCPSRRVLTLRGGRRPMRTARMLLVLSALALCTQFGCAGRRSCRTCRVPSCCAGCAPKTCGACAPPKTCAPCGPSVCRVPGAASERVGYGALQAPPSAEGTTPAEEPEPVARPQVPKASPPADPKASPSQPDAPMLRPLPAPEEPVPFKPEAPGAASGPPSEPAPPMPPQSSARRIWRYNAALLQQETTAR